MPQGNEQEILFENNEFIVTKTDTQGRILYANRVFMRVSNFAEADLLGQHHNIIRHSDMPRGVFYGLWNTLKLGQEFFGFVKNRTSDGNYYWVFANITPDCEHGKLVGYFSVRRSAPTGAKPVIQSIYQEMSQVEESSSRDAAPKLSWEHMVDKIQQQHGLSYSEFVIDLYNTHLD
jgi:aerotaxis receptor